METGCLLHCLEVEETNVFEAVKQSVTTRQAALVYGISMAAILGTKSPPKGTGLCASKAGWNH